MGALGVFFANLGRAKQEQRDQEDRQMLGDAKMFSTIIGLQNPDGTFAFDAPTRDRARQLLTDTTGSYSTKEMKQHVEQMDQWLNTVIPATDLASKALALARTGGAAQAPGAAPSQLAGVAGQQALTAQPTQQAPGTFPATPMVGGQPGAVTATGGLPAQTPLSQLPKTGPLPAAVAGFTPAAGYTPVPGAPAPGAAPSTLAPPGATMARAAGTSEESGEIPALRKPKGPTGFFGHLGAGLKEIAKDIGEGYTGIPLGSDARRPAGERPNIYSTPELEAAQKGRVATAEQAVRLRGALETLHGSSTYQSAVPAEQNRMDQEVTLKTLGVTPTAALFGEGGAVRQVWYRDPQGNPVSFFQRGLQLYDGDGNPVDPGEIARRHLTLSARPTAASLQAIPAAMREKMYEIHAINPQLDTAVVAQIAGQQLQAQFALQGQAREAQIGINEYQGNFKTGMPFPTVLPGDISPGAPMGEGYGPAPTPAAGPTAQPQPQPQPQAQPQPQPQPAPTTPAPAGTPAQAPAPGVIGPPPIPAQTPGVIPASPQRITMEPLWEVRPDGKKVATKAGLQTIERLAGAMAGAPISTARSTAAQVGNKEVVDAIAEISGKLPGDVIPDLSAYIGSLRAVRDNSLWYGNMLRVMNQLDVSGEIFLKAAQLLNQENPAILNKPMQTILKEYSPSNPQLRQYFVALNNLDKIYGIFSTGAPQSRAMPPVAVMQRAGHVLDGSMSARDAAATLQQMYREKNVDTEAYRRTVEQMRNELSSNAVSLALGGMTQPPPLPQYHGVFNSNIGPVPKLSPEAQKYVDELNKLKKKQ
jgi:hypothetical protein